MVVVKWGLRHRWSTHIKLKQHSKLIMDMIMNTSLIETWELSLPFLRITLAIFANYPPHFYELPSPFVRITLAIFANYPRHPHNNALNHPGLYIESPSPFDLFSQRDYRVTRPWILETMFPYKWWHYCWSHERLWLVRVHQKWDNSIQTRPSWLSRLRHFGEGNT